MDSLPPWSVVQALLLSVILPGFVVAAALLAIVAAATSSERARCIGAGLALAAGVVAGNSSSELLSWWPLEFGWPSLLPATVAALGGGIIAAIVSSSHCKWYWGPLLRLLVMAGCVCWLTPLSTPPTPARHWLCILLFAGCVLNWEAYRVHGTRIFGSRALLTSVIPWGPLPLLSSSTHTRRGFLR